MEYHDEEIIQECVEQHRSYSSHHGLVGMSGGTQYAVDSQIQVGKRVTRQDDDHVFAGITYGYIGRTEKGKYGIDEYQRQCAEQDAYKYVQGH